ELHGGRRLALPSHLVLAPAAGGLGVLGDPGSDRSQPRQSRGNEPGMRSTRTLQAPRVWVAPVVAGLVCAILLGACGTAHPGISNGSVSACYRAIPTARAAVRKPHVSVVGVHRVPADLVRGELPPAAQTVLVGDNDTTVCAVSFKGPFTPGQVALAPSNERGRYAVVLVTSRHLHLLASVLLDRLPRSLGRRTV